jgi:hypothetical protein
MSETWAITSNVYVADVEFDRPIPNFDFFVIQSILPEHDRYRFLGEAVAMKQREEKHSFAQYTPARDENYLVSYIPSDAPTARVSQLEGICIKHEGKSALPPTPAGRRTVTDLLNKSKFRELSRSLWTPGGHSFYPKIGQDLNTIYSGCNLIMFRGPFFRYGVLGNHKIVLTLDSSTHYVRSKPILDEIRRRNGVEWILKEIRRRRKIAEARRRRFTGLHFFYTLYETDVAVDDVDPRPISKIRLSKPITISGMECETIAEYLKARYREHPAISRLDESQPGLRSGPLTFAAQFLYQTVPLEEIPDTILNDQTFFMDKSPKHLRDIQKPAEARWDIINDYLHRYNFQRADLGPLNLTMGGPLDFPIDNHFELPRLLASGDRPVSVYEIESALSRGLFQPPQVKRVFLYSAMNWKMSETFYDEMVMFAQQKYSTPLPRLPVPLEREVRRMRTQLENSILAEGSDGSICIGIIPEESDLHGDLTNTWGDLKLPSKCVTIPIVESVCLEGRKFHLKDTLASMFARAGAIPWILHDKLHYGCYVAVDVGRALSEYWAMGIVYDKDGKFAIRQGRLTVGEDLDEQSVRFCLGEANRYAPTSESLIYLRHGEVFDTERRMFERVIADYPSYSDVALVSIKESVPYRIFRRLGDKIAKPLSGDYYFLDQNSTVLCAAGSDLYQHGMPKPIVAEIISVRGQIQAGQVVQDLFRLCFLNWGSPGRSYSMPAPIRLAHLMASELSLGIRRHGAPF